MVRVKKYVPDFPAMMRLYEINYAQLRRLVPRVNQVGETSVFQVNATTYRLKIEEVTRYTTVVVIQQTAPKVSYWRLPELRVRLYHDALIAEVCATQQIARFKARYDYPNKRLHQRDEKHQINQFLSDWLRFCLIHGTTPVPIS